MGQSSSHVAEVANTRDQDEARAHAPNVRAEKTPLNHGWGQTTIEDFYREGMGIAGKE
jgi:hypothetical protein